MLTKQVSKRIGACPASVSLSEENFTCNENKRTGIFEVEIFRADAWKFVFFFFFLIDIKWGRKFLDKNVIIKI